MTDPDPDPDPAPSISIASDERLDSLVLDAADAAWSKVAVFIAKVVDAAKAQGLDTSGQAIAQRIYALVESGQLEAKGNVRRWRAAEIHQPQPDDPS